LAGLKLITLVHFRCSTGVYAVPVEHAREVRLLTACRSLPEARPNVMGVVEGWGGQREETLTVVDTLGGGGEHLLILDRGDQPFGLLVEAVCGIIRVDESALGPPPEGQRSPVISGAARTEAGLLLLVDVNLLEATLSA